MFVRSMEFRKKTTFVLMNIIKISRYLINHQHEVTLIIDTMHIYGLAFLTIITRRILYQTTQYLTNQKAECCQSSQRVARRQ